MRLVGTRQRAIIIKELWALLRDKKGRIVLFLPPVIQLFLFSFAATLEVRNVDIAVLDRSSGTASSEFVSRIAGSPNFREIRRLGSYDELREAIDRQQVIAALVIDQDFDRNITNGQPASIGLVLDGRRSNASQIVGSYLAAIAGDVSLDISRSAAGSAGRGQNEGSIVRHWFNPNLDFLWFNLPTLLVIIVSVSGLAVTSLVIAREREMGTFDQLLVSPLRVHEILIGKMMPTVLVGMINGLIFIIAAQLVFGVPFTGNLPLFILVLLVYNIALIGVGMFVSAISMTQQQAFLGSFAATTPVILLSGFASPIANMPGWLQLVTYANPARYFMEVSLGTFLKSMPASVMLSLTWPIALIALITLGSSAWLFRARME